MGAENSAPAIRKDVPGATQQEQQHQSTREFRDRLARYDVSFNEAVVEACREMQRISSELEMMSLPSNQELNERIDEMKMLLADYLADLCKLEGILKCRGKNQPYFWDGKLDFFRWPRGGRGAHGARCRTRCTKGCGSIPSGHGQQSWQTPVLQR